MANKEIFTGLEIKDRVAIGKDATTVQTFNVRAISNSLGFNYQNSAGLDVLNMTGTSSNNVATFSLGGTNSFDVTAASIFRQSSPGVTPFNVVDVAGTTSYFQIQSNGKTIFNNNNANLDFNIQGTTDANLFYVDANANSVGIGIAAPTANLHVKTATSAGSTNAFLAENNINRALLTVKDNGEVFSNGYGEVASNTAFGQGIFSATFAGYNTTAFGRDALFGATTGWNNTAIGNNALRVMTTGSSNVAVGTAAMQSGNPIASVAVGYQALANATGNIGAVGIGYQAASNMTTGGQNTAVGYGSGAGTSGSNNTVIGWNSGRLIDIGGNNTAIGRTCLYNMTSGGSNTAIGADAAQNNLTGNNGVFVGKSAGFYETGTQKLYISTFNGTDEATGRTAALIYGDFHSVAINQRLTFNAKVGISGAATSTSSLNISNLPTGTAGLVAGDVWNNGGNLEII